MNGRKLRGTKEPLDECERGQWKSCLNTQKMKIKASGLITSWQIDGEKLETVADFFIFLGSKKLETVTVATKLKDACSLEEKLWQI